MNAPPVSLRFCSFALAIWPSSAAAYSWADARVESRFQACLRDARVATVVVDGTGTKVKRRLRRLGLLLQRSWRQNARDGWVNGLRLALSGGLALVFDHHLMHEGAVLLKGVKYAIRTDVMFRRVAEDAQAPPVVQPTGQAGGAGLS